LSPATLIRVARSSTHAQSHLCLPLPIASDCCEQRHHRRQRISPHASSCQSSLVAPGRHRRACLSHLLRRHRPEAGAQVSLNQYVRQPVTKRLRPSFLA
jgi:hypothetical protein